MNYDEGYGAIYPHMDVDRAGNIIELAKLELGERLELV